MTNEHQKIVRRAYGAGRWFPGDRDALANMLARFMDEAAPPAVTGRIVAALAPHAGYPFSGPVAGYTFRALRDAARDGDRPETVVIVGFCHGAHFPGFALLDGDVLTTPLGPVELDKGAAALMAESDARIFFDAAPHAGEHSAENEVPFTQAALPGVPIVVGLYGDHDVVTIEAVVKSLNALAARKRIVVVSSTDMLHASDYDLVTRTDHKTLEDVKRMDEAAVMERWSGSRQIFCGICPVITAMRYARAAGCTAATVLRYRNSGDDHPESRGNYVVGYGSVVFTVPAAK